MGAEFDIENVGWLIPAVVGIWAVYKFRYKNRAEMKAREIIKMLLNDPEYSKRSFKIIRRRVGSFDDEKLESMLVEIGAIGFESDDGEKMWGLESRNPIDASENSA